MPETPSISAWWVFVMSAHGRRRALDQPQLPQRLRAVEPLGEDPRDELAQLLPLPGAGSAVWRTWYSR